MNNNVTVSHFWPWDISHSEQPYSVGCAVKSTQRCWLFDYLKRTKLESNVFGACFVYRLQTRK